MTHVLFLVRPLGHAQVMQVLKTAFDGSATGLTLFPYHVIPMRVGAEKACGGIIECVPDVKSRDEVRG